MHNFNEKGKNIFVLIILYIFKIKTIIFQLLTGHFYCYLFSFFSEKHFSVIFCSLWDRCLGICVHMITWDCVLLHEAWKPSFTTVIILNVFRLHIKAWGNRCRSQNQVYRQLLNFSYQVATLIVFLEKHLNILALRRYSQVLTWLLIL